MKNEIERIYLDHASATPIDDEVCEYMNSLFKEKFGNPGALHKEGVNARLELINARKKIADAIGAHPDEIIFTSGATEANNLAIFGALISFRNQYEGVTPEIIVSAIEHSSVLEVVRRLGDEGVIVHEVLPDATGIVNVDDIKKLLNINTALVSLMYANNEIGTIQPLSEVGKIIEHHNKTSPRIARIHTDAVQAGNYLDMHVPRLHVDLMTISGAKVYGPKGVGALYIRRGTFLTPLFYGGSQEMGIRPGTENVPLIASFALAFHKARELAASESERLTKLRNHFIEEVLKKIPDTILMGDSKERLPNNVSFWFPGISGEMLVIMLDAKGVAVSSRSACETGSVDGSHVIMALGRSGQDATEVIRMGLGRGTTKEMLEKTVHILSECVAHIRLTKEIK